MPKFRRSTLKQVSAGAAAQFRIWRPILHALSIAIGQLPTSWYFEYGYVQFELSVCLFTVSTINTADLNPLAQQLSHFPTHSILLRRNYACIITFPASCPLEDLEGTLCYDLLRMPCLIRKHVESIIEICSSLSSTQMKHNTFKLQRKKITVLPLSFSKLLEFDSFLLPESDC